MINYIVEASVCLACFYSIYWLFLRREKLLSLNRFYLLSTAIISLIIPLLSFDIGLNLFSPASTTGQPALIQGGLNSAEVTGQSPIVSIGLIYTIGLGIAMVLLVVKFVYAKRRIGKKISLKAKPIEITETEGLGAYSFLNTIFIGKELSKNSELKEHIIAHESAHIEGMHSLDLFFFEVLKCVFWFNPFSYLYARSIKLQHEYIADQHALEMTTPASYQRSLLELTLSQVNSSLISNFNEHPIETRLKMIQKLNSNVMKKFKTLFALPVLALLVIGFACTETAEPEAELLDIIEEVPAGSGIVSPLTDRMLTIIDSMRVIKGNASGISRYEVKSHFDGAIVEYEEREIELTEIDKARFILKSLEEAKGNKANVFAEYIDESAPNLKRDLHESYKRSYNTFVERLPEDESSKKAKEALEVIVERKDGRKN
ncbi:M56 family metallopeptidase [Roseivirga sp. E12]|uniref:M56 family metallopeptidase n=1 Tax=Roseivirga sp. E12 TaxID=2819237 RepID=UPI001ABC0597|nr:M56 family metallopeptidase [Roseivirga sp. E12]MBO3700045.1 M56 family metallopeptidase [Roseivirga sp. E12]